MAKKPYASPRASRPRHGSLKVDAEVDRVSSACMKGGQCILRDLRVAMHCRLGWSDRVRGALASGAIVLAGVTGCGDDTLVIPADGGSDASIGTDGQGFETGAFDGGETLDGTLDGEGDATSSPPGRILLSYSTATQGELSVFGLRSMAVEGRIEYAGPGTTATTSTSPWLLKQAQDTVVRLDPLQPWIPRSSWSVASMALGDAPDGGDAGFATPNAQPIALVVGPGTSAYVLRYARNAVAVLDTSQDVDGGAPSTRVDLSSQIQQGGDGFVEMTGAYFDAPSGRLYVLLGNVDRFNVPGSDGTRSCSSTYPTVIAIDTTSNTLAPLAGDAGAAGYALQGYEPPVGPSPMVYDPTNNRLLVVERGCIEPAADGGTGTVTRRGVEAVSLTDGTVGQLLDLSASAAPKAIFYVDAHHVFVQLDTVYSWDPSTTTLGPPLVAAPFAFALDEKGNLVGVTAQGALDAGPAGFRLVSVSTSDGGVALLGTNPFSLTGGGVTGVQLWPVP
jgi:hypothetical protein